MAIQNPRKTAISALWPVLTLVVSAASWAALARGWQSVDRFARLAASVTLLGWFTLAGGWQGDTFWFGLGLVFSLVADFLLNSSRYFVVGIVALLFGHIFYIIGFSQTQIPIGPVSVIIAVLVWGAALLLFRQVTTSLRQREGGALLQLPAMIFSLAVSILLLAALATLARPEWSFLAAALVSVGGLLFFLSNGLRAADRFVNPIPHATLLVRVSFHLAQLCIIAGVLIHYSKF